LALGSALVLFVLALLTDFVGRKPTLEAALRQSTMDRVVGNYIRGADPVSAMGMESTLTSIQSAQQADQTTVLQRAVTTGAVISGISKAVRLGVQGLIMGLGAYLVVVQDLTPG